MRHRFKKYYETRLTKCKFVVGVFQNREKNCITLVLPQLLFKKGNTYDINTDQYNRLAHTIQGLINTYMQANGNIHIDELPLGLDVNNVINSTYNGSNIRWVEVNTKLYISYHQFVSSITMSKCLNVVNAYKERHTIRQSIIDDRIQLNRYKPGGVYYEQHIRNNDIKRNQQAFDTIQSRIDGKVEDITELSNTIKEGKKAILSSIGKRDKGLLKYYLYLANKKIAK